MTCQIAGSVIDGPPHLHADTMKALAAAHRRGGAADARRGAILSAHSL
jgi:hypothetical protein